MKTTGACAYLPPRAQALTYPANRGSLYASSRQLVRKSGPLFAGVFAFLDLKRGLGYVGELLQRW